MRNYFINDDLNGDQDPTLGVWDRFFDFGDPNRHSQAISPKITKHLDEVFQKEGLNRLDFFFLNILI